MKISQGYVVAPLKMWSEILPILERDIGSDPHQQQLFRTEGALVELRLQNGDVKNVLVRSNGHITHEHYEEYGIRAEKYGSPRFNAEDIESWGYWEKVRQPTWRNPFKKVKVWRVRVWADGRLGYWRESKIDS